jgi:hypothetical protein
MMIEKERAAEMILTLAREQFPQNEYVIETTQFADGDYRFEAFHTKGETGDGVLREVIEITPHHVERQLVEITETREGTYIERETIND